MALGAGAFWDVTVAMGVSPHPGESITALTEAISVIRTIWDTKTRGGVRLEGAFYPVTGANAGRHGASDRDLARRVQTADAPADRSGSRRLAAVDGLPATGAVDPALGAIDEAARGAGRDPRSIRRLYNINGTFSDRSEGFLHGPAAQWIEQLSELVLTHGMSTFILGSDDADDLARFADVAPGVREAVRRALRGETEGR